MAFPGGGPPGFCTWAAGARDKDHGDKPRGSPVHLAATSRETPFTQAERHPIFRHGYVEFPDDELDELELLEWPDGSTTATTPSTTPPSIVLSPSPIVGLA
jgi:hypothetical protein